MTRAPASVTCKGPSQCTNTRANKAPAAMEPRASKPYSQDKSRDLSPAWFAGGGQNKGKTQARGQARRGQHEQAAEKPLTQAHHHPQLDAHENRGQAGQHQGERPRPGR